MSIKIKYTKIKSYKTTSNTVLFVNEKFNISHLKKLISNDEFSYINDLIKTSDLKKKLLVFEVNSKKKLILISIKKNLKSFDIENLGAELYKHINHGKDDIYNLNTDSLISNYKNFIGLFLHGLKLKSYQFKKYKTKKINKNYLINVFGNKYKPSASDILKFKSLEEGTFYARDLVSEPGNI